MTRSTLPSSLLFVLSLLLCIGGSCAALPKVPTANGSGWIEVTTEHFRIRSELDEKATLATLAVLEETRAAMLATIWPEAPAGSRRIEVVLLQSSAEVAELFRQEPDGVRLHASFPYPSVVVIAGTPTGTNKTIAIHELAHEIGLSTLPLARPLWYVEGAASYLETMLYERWSGHLTRGRVTNEQARWVASGSRWDSKRLLDDDEGTSPTDLFRFERTAWLLFHYLVDERSRDLREFQSRLSRLDPPEDAWENVFEDLNDPSVLDSVLRQYSRAGLFKTFEAEVPPPRYTARKRAMTVAEAHGVRARFLALSRESNPDGRTPSPLEDLAAAFAEDPGAVDAAAVALYTKGLRVKGPKDRLGLAQEVARRHPESWQAWLMLEAESPRGSIAGLVALDKAHKLAPNELLVNESLAIHLSDMGRNKEALYFSSEAIANHAGGTALLGLHSRLLASQGRCEDARIFRALWRVRPTDARAADVLGESPCWTSPVKANAKANTNTATSATTPSGPATK